ncbi:hypothetical protein HPB47_016037 [Ixodes persulcatus]|uniref:Uncharacterized protein n=1 Tax=Ixodes persulcatus TaxID=34615 RepID=A0AC60QRW5_IXOPE|nr:hypothetical protein HPB47_016037 [Ixodes persulcatus]
MAKISYALIVALCVVGGLAGVLVNNQEHSKTHVNTLGPDEAPQEIFPETPLGFYMVVDAKKAGHNVARLITPYMPVYANTTACVAIFYVVNGPGADKLEILAQDSANRHLITLPSGASNWMHVERSINVTQDVRVGILSLPFATIWRNYNAL